MLNYKGKLIVLLIRPKPNTLLTNFNSKLVFIVNIIILFLAYYY